MNTKQRKDRVQSALEEVMLMVRSVPTEWVSNVIQNVRRTWKVDSVERYPDYRRSSGWRSTKEMTVLMMRGKGLRIPYISTRVLAITLARVVIDIPPEMSNFINQVSVSVRPVSMTSHHRPGTFLFYTSDLDKIAEAVLKQPEGYSWMVSE